MAHQAREIGLARVQHQIPARRTDPWPGPAHRVERDGRHRRGKSAHGGHRATSHGRSRQGIQFEGAGHARMVSLVEAKGKT